MISHYLLSTLSVSFKDSQRKVLCPGTAATVGDYICITWQGHIPLPLRRCHQPASAAKDPSFLRTTWTLLAFSPPWLSFFHQTLPKGQTLSRRGYVLLEGGKDSWRNREMNWPWSSTLSSGGLTSESSCSAQWEAQKGESPITSTLWCLFLSTYMPSCRYLFVPAQHSPLLCAHNGTWFLPETAQWHWVMPRLPCEKPGVLLTEPAPCLKFDPGGRCKDRKWSELIHPQPQQWHQPWPCLAVEPLSSFGTTVSTTTKAFQNTFFKS